MNRILRTVLSLGLLLSVTTGCWNRQEPDKVEYVLAAGIDLNDKGQIVLTVLTPVLEALKPMSGLKGEQKKDLECRWEYNIRGCTILYKNNRQKLYWSHLQILLIGESAAKTDARYYFDFFSSDPELRGTAYMATVKGRALDILESSPDITALSSNYLKEIIKNSDLEGKAAQVYLSEFARKLAQPTGAQPFSPIIRLIDQSEYVKKIVGVKPYEAGDTHQSTLFYANGTGVYSDGKMVGTLNGTETRGFLWVMGKMKSALVVVPCPDETDCSISLELSGEKSSKRRVEYQDGKAKIQLHIAVEFNIGDKASTKFKTNPQTIAYVQDQFSKTIQNEVKMAFHKVAVEYHSDIFGFGNSLEDRDPKLWKQIKDRWENEILPEADLDIQVTSKLRRTSRTLYSPWVNSDHS